MDYALLLPGLVAGEAILTTGGIRKELGGLHRRKKGWPRRTGSLATRGCFRLEVSVREAVYELLTMGRLR
jgi:hypothetical protein